MAGIYVGREAAVAPGAFREPRPRPPALLLHPDQVGPCNDVFSPSAIELERARAIVQAFEDPEHAGKGAIRLEGMMVELLHLDQARRVLATAAAIAGDQPQAR